MKSGAGGELEIFCINCKLKKLKQIKMHSKVYFTIVYFWLTLYYANF